jgi:hypothetical protein
MNPPLEYKSLMETGRNGSLYCLYKLKTMPEEYDASAVTYLISTIDSFLREKSTNSTVFSRATVSDTLFSVDQYICVQIVAPQGTVPKEKCMYWAEGSNLVTGTMILSRNEKLPHDKANTYGSFKDDIRSTCRRTSFWN